jgi:hypothetical protein
LLKGPKGRFGRLQRQCDRAFIVYDGEVTTRQLAEWCYPRLVLRGERLSRWRIDNQARAAKSIGARPAERTGAERVWRLRQTNKSDIGSANGSKAALTKHRRLKLWA